MSAAVRLPQRGKAYQPRVQPWEWDGGYECVLKERRIGRTWRGDAAVCRVPSKRLNPKGIASSSPALARQRLRWGQRKMHINSERVESSRTSGTNPEHHREVAFRDQLRALRRRYEIEFDERYVWD